MSQSNSQIVYQRKSAIIINIHHQYWRGKWISGILALCFLFLIIFKPSLFNLFTLLLFIYSAAFYILAVIHTTQQILIEHERVIVKRLFRITHYDIKYFDLGQFCIQVNKNDVRINYLVGTFRLKNPDDVIKLTSAVSEMFRLKLYKTLTLFDGTEAMFFSKKNKFPH